MRNQLLAAAFGLVSLSGTVAWCDTTRDLTDPTDPIVRGAYDKSASQPAGASADAKAKGSDPEEFRPMYESSSNPTLVDSPDAPEARADAAMYGGGRTKAAIQTRAFSAVAFNLKFGSAGFGFDVATPLAKRLNLRGGGSFFTANPQFTLDGIDVLGGIEFRSITADLDIFPFNSTFRISPGMYLYNDNHIGASTFVAGGQTFSLNDVTFTSSLTDPVNGSFAMQFGNKVAPTITLGFGNMIPRGGGHWAFTSEIGIGYVGMASVALKLNGTACYSGVVLCTKFGSDPTLQQDLKDEQTNLSNDFNSAHGIFPILSTGLSYSFNIPGRR